MSLNLFLKRTVDPNASVDLDDAARTKLALKSLGYLRTPDKDLSEYPDTEMFESIKRFQAGNDLKVDGVIKPGGETENHLLQAFGPTPWTLSPNPPDRECAGQWVSAGKDCLGQVCIYYWQCLEKSDDSPRG